MEGYKMEVEPNFVVALKAKSGEFCLYVEAFMRRNGRNYLKHTTRLEEARRMTRFAAEDMVKAIEEYHCTARVERIEGERP